MLFWGFRLAIWRSPWAFCGADGGALLALSQLFACLATVCLVFRYQAAAELVQQAMMRTTVAVMARAIVRPFICDVAVIVPRACSSSIFISLIFIGLFVWCFSISSIPAFICSRVMFSICRKFVCIVIGSNLIASSRGLKAL